MPSDSETPLSALTVAGQLVQHPLPFALTLDTGLPGSLRARTVLEYELVKFERKFELSQDVQIGMLPVQSRGHHIYHGRKGRTGSRASLFAQAAPRNKGRGAPSLTTFTYAPAR